MGRVTTRLNIGIDPGRIPDMLDSDYNKGHRFIAKLEVVLPVDGCVQSICLVPAIDFKLFLFTQAFRPASVKLRPYGAIQIRFRVPPGHGKSRKVMEFRKTIYQAWKVMENSEVSK